VLHQDEDREMDLRLSPADHHSRTGPWATSGTSVVVESWHRRGANDSGHDWDGAGQLLKEPTYGDAAHAAT
jgi:hypothetical protein